MKHQVHCYQNQIPIVFILGGRETGDLEQFSITME